MKRHCSLFLAAVSALLLTEVAAAHCDSLDGPVVVSARKALDSGDPNPALIWVRPAQEAEARAAFQQALVVRKKGGDARDLADRYFFETLVRLHRAGESAPFTGLKPAGQDRGPAVTLADEAIDAGSERELASFLSREVTQALRERFEDLQRKRSFRPDDLPAGREYVESYVRFVQLAEAVHESASAKSHGHPADAGMAESHHCAREGSGGKRAAGS